MSRSTGRRAALATILAAGLVLGALTAAPAGAATLTACVKKKTGEMRLRSGKAAKKACPKGWSKLRWTTTGPKGTTGPAGGAGPAFSVRDRNGATLGQFLGLSNFEIPIVTVLRDGGIWTYGLSGVLIPTQSFSSPEFKTNTCDGTAYLTSAPDAILNGFFGSLFRLVYRPSAGAGFGPARAWKIGSTPSEALAAVQLYRLDSSGTCAADGAPFTGTARALDTVAAPADVPGPLSFG